jgi:hypothetical protein
MTGFWTGSVTTWMYHNPTFRAVIMDSETMLPVDMVTYVWNISDTKPEWREFYSYRQLYNLTDLSPASMIELSERFGSDKELALTERNLFYGRDDKYTSVSTEYQKYMTCVEQNANTFDIADCRGTPRLDWKNDGKYAAAELFAGTYYEVMPGASIYKKEEALKKRKMTNLGRKGVEEKE